MLIFFDFDETVQMKYFKIMLVYFTLCSIIMRKINLLSTKANNIKS